MKTEVTQDDKDAIRDLLLFHSVAVVSDDKLVLDDGTELTIEPNDGGCSCGAGDYAITALNGCDNVITSVTVEEETDARDDTVYSVFVYAENQQINLLSVSGNDGSGYYGTGYRIRVTKPVGEN